MEPVISYLQSCRQCLNGTHVVLCFTTWILCAVVTNLSLCQSRLWFQSWRTWPMWTPLIPATASTMEPCRTIVTLRKAAMTLTLTESSPPSLAPPPTHDRLMAASDTAGREGGTGAWRLIRWTRYAAESSSFSWTRGASSRPGSTCRGRCSSSSWRSSLSLFRCGSWSLQLL